MDTQGVVIWARARSLIVWCADGGTLAYVADRRTAGDPHAALSVGDLVDLRVDTVGAMRVGTALSYRAAGASEVVGTFRRTAEAQLGPVMSGDAQLNRVVARGADVADEVRRREAANRRRDSGAA